MFVRLSSIPTIVVVITNSILINASEILTFKFIWTTRWMSAIYFVRIITAIIVKITTKLRSYAMAIIAAKRGWVTHVQSANIRMLIRIVSTIVVNVTHPSFEDAFTVSADEMHARAVVVLQNAHLLVVGKY